MGEMADYYNQFDYDEFYFQHDPDPEDKQYRPYNIKESLMKKNRKQKPIKNDPRPLMVAIGKHIINPREIKLISQVRRDLFVVKFNGAPETYPCWLNEKEASELVKFLKIVEA